MTNAPAPKTSDAPAIEKLSYGEIVALLNLRKAGQGTAVQERVVDTAIKRCIEVADTMIQAYGYQRPRGEALGVALENLPTEPDPPAPPPGAVDANGMPLQAVVKSPEQKQEAVWLRKRDMFPDDYSRDAHAAVQLGARVPPWVQADGIILAAQRGELDNL